MEESPRPKQAACLVCRRSKIKCDWTPGDRRCRRCAQLDTECVRPYYQPGRKKGHQNKRRGLDKAMFQIDEVIRRARSGTQVNSEDQQVLARLRQLLDQPGNVNPSPSTWAAGSSETDYTTAEGAADTSNHFSDEETAPRQELRDVPGVVQRDQSNLAIDDAENPLELLARASYNIQTSPESRYGTSPQSVQVRSTSSKEQHQIEDKLKSFFSPTRSRLDIGPDIDPVSLGLVAENECETLFTYYHENLAHTRWGVDPSLYNASFTRSRSAFLFTTITAAAALFMPTRAALSKRLSNHVKRLADNVMTNGYKSVEIVMAFMINIPWLFPGKQSSDDETCAYFAMANTVATDLSLHKKIVAANTLEGSAALGLSRGLSRADCLEPATALAIDGYPNLSPWSERGKVLLRSRERCWIALFVLDRGMSLARGRPFSILISQNIKDCDNWHRSALEATQDGPLVSIAVLRRDLDGLFSTVRALCDSSKGHVRNGALIAESIQGAIERFFDQWLTEWGVAIGMGPERRLPPYVEILVVHTRLSIYGHVINHPTAPLEVKKFFHTAGLSSALNVMRAAIQGESQLRSMPNNTTIMISFAACFALNLSAFATGDSGLAPSIRNLIEEAATVLIRLGRVTDHRNGLSVLHGQYLQQIVRRAALNVSTDKGKGVDTAGSAAANSRAVPSSTTMPPTTHNEFLQGGAVWPETFQFSAMSDQQIQQVLNQPGNDLESSYGEISWDLASFDWLYWPEIGT